MARPSCSCVHGAGHVVRTSALSAERHGPAVGPPRCVAENRPRTRNDLGVVGGTRMNTLGLLLWRSLDRRFRRRCSGLGDVLVLLGRVSAHADSTDDTLVAKDRDASLERRRTR